jgi:hypothetical protein
LKVSLKGKASEGILTDTDIALQLYQQGLESNASILLDRRMAISIASAVQSDGRIVNETNRAEKDAARDRLTVYRKRIVYSYYRTGLAVGGRRIRYLFS